MRPRPTASDSLSTALHGIDPKTGALQFRDERTDEDRYVESSVVIGCDGSASAIRSEMLKLSRFNFSQQYLDYGYKELTIPAGVPMESMSSKPTLFTSGHGAITC